MKPTERPSVTLSTTHIRFLFALAVIPVRGVYIKKHRKQHSAAARDRYYYTEYGIFCSLVGYGNILCGMKRVLLCCCTPKSLHDCH